MLVTQKPKHCKKRETLIFSKYFYIIFKLIICYYLYKNQIFCFVIKFIYIMSNNIYLNIFKSLISSFVLPKIYVSV